MLTADFRSQNKVRVSPLQLVQPAKPPVIATYGRFVFLLCVGGVQLSKECSWIQTCEPSGVRIIVDPVCLCALDPMLQNTAKLYCWPARVCRFEVLCHGSLLKSAFEIQQIGRQMDALNNSNPPLTASATPVATQLNIMPGKWGRG